MDKGGTADCMLTDISLAKPHSIAKITTGKHCVKCHMGSVVFTYKTQQDMVYG